MDVSSAGKFVIFCLSGSSGPSATKVGFSEVSRNLRVRAEADVDTEANVHTNAKPATKCPISFGMAWIIRKILCWRRLIRTMEILPKDLAGFRLRSEKPGSTAEGARLMH